MRLFGVFNVVVFVVFGLSKCRHSVKSFVGYVTGMTMPMTDLRCSSVPN